MFIIPAWRFILSLSSNNRKFLENEPFKKLWRDPKMEQKGLKRKTWYWDSTYFVQKVPERWRELLAWIDRRT